jgi:hypothetical protein
MLVYAGVKIDHLIRQTGPPIAGLARNYDGLYRKNFNACRRSVLRGLVFEPESQVNRVVFSKKTSSLTLLIGFKRLQKPRTIFATSPKAQPFHHKKTLLTGYRKVCP